MFDFEKKFDPDNWFITSDFHLNHVNMCSATTKWDKGFRQFPSLEMMNDTIISECNRKVGQGAVLFMVGDFLFGDKQLYENFRRRIVCQNIYYVYGNHDQWLRKNSVAQQAFKWCGDLAEIKVGHQKVAICHYAMKVWNKSHHKSWCLYGHSHGSLKDDPNLLSIDIGVDARKMYTGNADYAPWSFNELSKTMSKKTWAAVDHHGPQTN